MNPLSTPVWTLARDRHAAPLPPRLEVDVAVVGGGIAGLTAALLLRQRGRSVAVLERETAGSGESGRSTAHVTAAIDARYHHLKRTFGPEGAKVAASCLQRAIGTIEELAHRYAPDCRFSRLPAYIYSEVRADVAALKSEAASAKDAGLHASFVTDVPLPFATRGAVRFDGQGQLDPVCYVSGLAHALAGGLFERTRVLRVDAGDRCVVETSSGTVTAGAVFLATNTPINDIMAIQPKIAAYRTYAIGSRWRGERPNALFWDTNDPYHYIRWDNGWIIIGGEDHKVGQESHTESRFDALEAFGGEHFGVAAPEHRWSGQIIEPADGLPFIGRDPGRPNVFVATGFAGQGVTFGTVAGTLICDAITGVENDAAALFEPSRGALGREQLRVNHDYPKEILRDLLRLDVDTARTFDVKSGEGKIVSVGGRKLAVARDHAGRLHALSPVCRHMGCDVAWNAAEASWDCPCHGSRYTIDGAVLNGPATEDLEQVPIEEADGTRL